MHPNCFLESQSIRERLEFLLRAQNRCFAMQFTYAEKFQMDEEQVAAKDMLAEANYYVVQMCPPLHYGGPIGEYFLKDYKVSCCFFVRNVKSTKFSFIKRQGVLLKVPISWLFAGDPWYEFHVVHC